MAKPLSTGTDLSTPFGTEWEQAQQAYRDAIMAGYAPEVANQLHLVPVMNKWKIIQSSPLLLENPSRRNEFSDEYDQAATNARKNFQEGGAELFNQTLQPTLQKWEVEATMPQPPKVSPKAFAEALNAVHAGADPLEELAKNPELGQDPISKTTFDSLVKNEINRSLKPTPMSASDAEKLKALKVAYYNALTTGKDPDGTKLTQSKLDEYAAKVDKFQQEHGGNQPAQSVTGVNPLPSGSLAPTEPAATLLNKYPAHLNVDAPQGTSGYVEYDSQGKPIIAPWSMTIGGKTTRGGGLQPTMPSPATPENGPVALPPGTPLVFGRGGMFANLNPGLNAAAPDAKPAPVASRVKVPGAAIEYLKNHPDTAAQFEEKFGKGSSQPYLSQ